MDTHLELIDALQPLIRALDRRIEQAAEDDPTVELLRTVPGIGPYRGLLLAAEVLPVERFPSPAHLVSYAGFAPRTRSSGGRTRHGRIPRVATARKLCRILYAMLRTGKVWRGAPQPLRRTGRAPRLTCARERLFRRECAVPPRIQRSSARAPDTVSVSFGVP